MNKTEKDMRILVQRVKQAKVTVDHQVVGSIGEGLLAFLGIRTGDTETEARFLADKILNLRIFEDEDGKLNRSLLEESAELMIISQFTLYGDCRKGRRPSFGTAARPLESEPLYHTFIELCKAGGASVETGQFGEDMDVHLINDGPVTLWLERESTQNA